MASRGDASQKTVYTADVNGAYPPRGSSGTLMQLRLPLWYILVLLWTFLLKGRAASICRSSKQARDDDDDDDDSDDDDDDDDDDDNSHHHTCITDGTTSRGVSKGSVAAIVISCLLLLLLLILLILWCRRRRARSRQPVELPAGRGTTTPRMSERTPAGAHPSDHPFALRPRSVVAQSPANNTPANAMVLSGSPGRTQTQELSNVAPDNAAPPTASTESIPLPNPYEQDTPPPPPPRDRAVASPTVTSPPSRYASLYSTSSPTEYSHSHSHSHSHARSYSYSSAPSAWTHDDSAVPLLSRGTTQASRLTASSSLHEEMAGYQKALEAHHRKEEDEAQRREARIGEGSAIPEDPPPVYRDREEHA